MKLEIVKEPTPKTFKPVGLKLTVESIQELRLLFHVFNRGSLKNAIMTSSYSNDYSSDCADFFGWSLSGQIKKEIKDQGFQV